VCSAAVNGICRAPGPVPSTAENAKNTKRLYFSLSALSAFFAVKWLRFTASPRRLKSSGALVVRRWLRPGTAALRLAGETVEGPLPRRSSAGRARWRSATLAGSVGQGFVFREVSLGAQTPGYCLASFQDGVVGWERKGVNAHPSRPPRIWETPGSHVNALDCGCGTRLKTGLPRNNFRIKVSP
jgi:hypothetical protein